MSFDSNSGSVYYEIPCGVPSDVGIDINSNKSTAYYHITATDYILWGQATRYAHPQTNKGSNPYYLECNRSSDSGLDLNSNKGSKYYYNVEFNCVSFCEGEDTPL